MKALTGFLKPFLLPNVVSLVFLLELIGFALAFVQPVRISLESGKALPGCAKV